MIGFFGKIKGTIYSPIFILHSFYNCNTFIKDYYISLGGLHDFSLFFPKFHQIIADFLQNDYNIDVIS